jgi:hypothetical protein
MGHCWICEKKNDNWFSNDTCEYCTKLVALVKAIGSEKITRCLTVRLKDLKSYEGSD